MFFSPLDLTGIRSPVSLSHRHHHHHPHDFLPPASDPLTSSSSHVYNFWQNTSDFPSPYGLQQHSTPASDPLRRSFHHSTYQSLHDDRSSNSRLVPMLPYSTNESFVRRVGFPPPQPSLGLSSSAQHIPTTNVDERSSRSLIFDTIYPSPSYTLSAAISSAPGSASPTTSPPSAPAPAPQPPPPPPPSSSSPHTSPSPTPPSSPDCNTLPAPPLPSVQAFRLDTLQSVDPSDDPCPLSLNDLMIPSEEQEYQGHSYHFSLQSVSPPKSRPQSFSDERPPHEEASHPKRKGKSKMHTCTICQKSFPRPSGLRTHMNSHSGDKPYKCPVSSCAKSFTVRSNAKRHIRTHGIHSPFPQAAEAASLTGGDSSFLPMDKDPQRALRIRWVGQNPDEHLEDHPNGQPLNPQSGTCIRDLRHESNADDDHFPTNRLGDVCNRNDQLEEPFGSPGSSVGTLRGDPCSRKFSQKHSSRCSSVLVKKVV